MSDYIKGLNTHAFFKVSNHTLSEHLVQDTFIKTWGYLVKGGRIETMRAFLYHVLNDLIIDEYRKKKTISLDSLIEKGFEPSTENTDRLIDFLDGKSAVLLIKKLPIAYQKIMHMKYVQLLTLSEISLLTGQSKNSISVKSHRGLSKLKTLYEHTK